MVKLKNMNRQCCPGESGIHIFSQNRKSLIRTKQSRLLEKLGNHYVESAAKYKEGPDIAFDTTEICRDLRKQPGACTCVLSFCERMSEVSNFLPCLAFPSNLHAPGLHCTALHRQFKLYSRAADHSFWCEKSNLWKRAVHGTYCESLCRDEVPMKKMLTGYSRRRTILTQTLRWSPAFLEAVLQPLPVVMQLLLVYVLMY